MVLVLAGGSSGAPQPSWPYTPLPKAPQRGEARELWARAAEVARSLTGEAVCPPGACGGRRPGLKAACLHPPTRTRQGHAGGVLVHPQLGRPLPLRPPEVKTAGKFLAADRTGAAGARKEKFASELLRDWAWQRSRPSGPPHADGPGQERPPSPGPRPAGAAAGPAPVAFRHTISASSCCWERPQIHSG